MWMATRPESARTTRLVLENPTDVPLAIQSNHPDIAIAPDGSHIVFWTQEDGQDRLYVRPLDAYAAVALEDLGVGARGAFVSADSEWVGFYTGGALNKVALRGGAPIEICSVQSFLRGASWHDDDIIVFANSDRSEGLLRVSAAGGEPEILTRPDLDNGENNHVWPHFLPGGTHVLFTIDRGSGLETMDIAVFDLATREQEILIRGGTYPRYAATGHIVYATSRGLEAVSFDLDRLEVTSEPLPLARDVVVKRLGAADFDVSGDGTFVYTTGGVAGGISEFVWVDRQGRKEPLGVDPAVYRQARVSPDGRRIATTNQADGDIWIFDVGTESLSRLTFDASVIETGLWTPDGERIVFHSTKDGGGTLSWKASDGSGQSERITDGAFLLSLTPDGRYAIALEGEGGTNIVLVPLEPDAEPELLMERLHRELALSVSPDGKWLAFQSVRTGRNEIYLRPFPNVDDGLWQISTETGVAPQWGPTSRELFYRRRNELIAATLDMNPVPRVLASTTLFETQSRMYSYDVAPDGKRLLMLEPVESTSDSARIHVVLNWLDELQRQLPHP